MEDYISISTLNDFIFCPYSIYLHNVYMETDVGLYHATPQTSEEYGLIGKIDIYKGKERRLIERKYQLKNIYQGQIYQLWAQYLCMIEMGYVVDSIAFYEISTNKMIPVQLPGQSQLMEFRAFIDAYRHYDPSQPIQPNANKCHHCIYCSICDKMEGENVYQ